MIVYGERLLAGPRGDARRARAAQRRRAARAARPRRRGPARDPAATNGRGMREAGFAAGHGPGYADARRAAGRDAAGSPRGSPTATSPRSTCCTPTRCARTPTARVGARARRRADVIAARVRADGRRCASTPTSSSPPRPTRRRRARSSHPDGRVQRLRPAIGRPGAPTPGRCAPAGRSSPTSPRAPGTDPASRRADGLAPQLFEAVPFYAGLTLDEIGGRGVRWPARAAAARARAAPWEPAALDVRAPPARAGATARCGSAPAARCGPPRRSTSRPRCSSCARSQVVELSPRRRRPLGIREGDQVEVGANGTRVRGAVRLRAAVPAARCSSSRARRPAGQRAHRPLVEVAASAAPTAARRRRDQVTPRSRAAEAPPPPLDPATDGQRGAAHDRPRRGRLLRAVVDPAPEGAG